jgi:hypothetical protein
MRKTYNAPEMKVVEIQTAASMLTGSFDLNSTTVSGSSALSRESDGSFWDDDEDY